MKKTLAVLFFAGSLALLALSPARSAALPMLRTSGMQIADASGNPVVLTGVNLGGWLVEEPWMCPFVTDPPAGSDEAKDIDHDSIWNTAKERFGDAGVERIRDAYRDNWIDESDFARIHANGMNCVRLPFLSSLFDEPGGIQWLDDAIAWAKANDLYVILDMHGAPGRQSKDDHTGKAGDPRFFTDGANVEKAAQIWAMLASRYKDEPTVAGYDLLNEAVAAPTSDTLYVVYDRLYRAIRKVDTAHIIFIEDAYTGMQWMPFPIPAGWANVVYSSHYYDFDAKSRSDQTAAWTKYLNSVETEMKRRNIPWLVGEYQFEPFGDASVTANALQTMRSQGIASTAWTYKAIWAGSGYTDLWGEYSNTQPVDKLDFFTDSEQVLIAKCRQFRTENLTANTPEIDAFKSAGQ